MIQNRAWRFTRWLRKRTLVVLLVATVALLLPAVALATQFFSGTLQAGQFASAGSSVTAVSDQTQKNSGSGCVLTFFNIVGSNVYQTCSNTTFTVSAREATGHSPAADPACGARYASVNVTCRYFNGF